MFYNVDYFLAVYYIGRVISKFVEEKNAYAQAIKQDLAKL